MTNLASTKQITFINSLMEERDIAPQTLADIKRTVSDAGFTSREASQIITSLLNLPRKPKPEGYVERMRREEQEMFEGAENSYYAVPAAVIGLLPAFERVRGLAFFRIYTYKGRRYLRMLHGAPGDFRTTRLSQDNQRAVLSLLIGHHVEYARLFGENFERCGRCAAPLTDEKSRELHVGPECRKVWGL